ncbi:MULTISPECIES: TetR/AcrR family transcriptional regulator [Pedobacter]|uniref:Regulatory protein TetR n=1 Tax=Pedobacter heparinus (strain ATCC 13125 / DSM 2366 / CIP 104194 / JCM 7457 / NBRC 12017 / NCIMB 9290 / NRRL B-14731 / HIM 762-3) TaxID=485917 RepID=C6XUA2_PEDHD|nr:MULTISPECIES: TetR/AcrR family transcriptional regulator [Pedobacter]ACU05895.1 regulatory protein TetR [Pedobacter heparinus DSM 2366]MBB5438675.1 TetR/AcrR family transcriptional repressor of mexJK operon [Pedobacter sp. AK017]
MENQDKKKVLIIEAALKRFAHYGLSKTTMTEIAKDISFSKALLYYYFPDKLSLYVSAIEHLMQIISRDLVKSIDKTSSSTEGIFKLLQKRQSFIQKYYNLLESTQLIGNELPDDLYQKFSKARAFEAIIISSLFSRGVTSGEFIIEDPKLTTEIFIDALSGIHFNIMSKDKNIFPVKEQFKQIFIKEKLFAEIFLEGLRPKK